MINLYYIFTNKNGETRKPIGLKNGGLVDYQGIISGVKKLAGNFKSDASKIRKSWHMRSAKHGFRTVDGSEIQHPPTCDVQNPIIESWDKLPTSTGDRRISAKKNVSRRSRLMIFFVWSVYYIYQREKIP